MQRLSSFRARSSAGLGSDLDSGSDCSIRKALSSGFSGSGLDSVNSCLPNVWVIQKTSQADSDSPVISGPPENRVWASSSCPI